MVTTSGDPDLAEDVRRRLGRRHERFVVVAVGREGTRLATHGLAPDAEVEIGSVSKGLTGLLFLDACERGEVHPATPLGSLLPLADSDAAAVTLGDLATHRSGLPRLPATGGVLRATWDLWRHGTNPYGQSLEELLSAARDTPAGRRRAQYSNLGFMLLGHALAAAAGTTYAGLLRDRLTGPLGMVATSVPATPDELGAAAVHGRSARGIPSEPWTGEGLGPAGGIRSTAGDLGRLLRALLDGTAPGVRALDPVQPFSGGLRIGAAWLTLERRGTQLMWHNGGTGGFRSIVALDRSAGTGVALVSATARSVDPAGFGVLERLSSAAPPPGGLA